MNLHVLECQASAILECLGTDKTAGFTLFTSGNESFWAKVNWPLQANTLLFTHNTV